MNTSHQNYIKYLWPIVLLVGIVVLPWMRPRYDVYVTNQILIYSLFGLSLNMLVGLTGLMSFGHVAYFGIGAYACGLLMKNLDLSFWWALPSSGLVAAFFSLVFGFFCVRLTKVYFAMLTLAFSQIAWAICLKWTALTGGEQGLSNVPYPDLDWLAALPGFGHFRASELFYFLNIAVIASLTFLIHRVTNSPFGRVLTTIRENPQRAAFIGINVRAYELAVFVVAGTIAGFAGALFCVFNRGIFPDYLFWTKSADGLISLVLGGLHYFWGPVVGAVALIILNQQATAYTQYWSFVLGVMLIFLLFVCPIGILGLVDRFGTYARRRMAAFKAPSP